MWLGARSPQQLSAWTFQRRSFLGMGFHVGMSTIEPKKELHCKVQVGSCMWLSL